MAAQLGRPRLSVNIARSVDGYIADADGSLDWLFARAALEGEDYGHAEFMSSVDGLAMGRGTWDFIADEPSLPFEGRPVFVFTHRDATAREGVHFWSRTPREAVAEWHEAGLDHVYVDGGRLISDFLAEGLVDDLTLTVVPVLLGSGSRLFHEIPVLTSLAAGDEQAHPLGAADGDRIELRRYQPGDPARFIHWKIYARTGKLLVRQPERSLTQTTRTVAYLIAGPRDEASAAAARVALEQGALGADWLFGADGTPTPASDLPAALEAIVRSGDTHAKPAGDASGDTHPSLLEPFIQEAELRGPARIVVFAPPTPGEWVSSLGSLLELAAARPGRVHVVIGVDGVSRHTPHPLAVRLLRTPAPQLNDDLAALDALRATLQAAGVDSVVVDRRSGQVLSDAHLRAALEAA